MGSAAILVLSFIRIVRLRGLLARAASISHDASSEVDRVKAMAKLDSEPRVLVVDARVTPFILPFGWKPALVLPQPLLRTLDPEERATLIAHELAHLRRRDHWLAWIELAAVALYWWLPVAWLARNFARRSCENCCDGWVLRWLPGSALTYANALLKVIDFIAPQRLAPLDFAPAMGRFSLTKWRLAMILENTCCPQMPRAARLVAWPLCAVLLACTPALRAQGAIGRRRRPRNGVRASRARRFKGTRPCHGSGRRQAVESPANSPQAGRAPRRLR